MTSKLLTHATPLNFLFFFFNGGDVFVFFVFSSQTAAASAKHATDACD